MSIFSRRLILAGCAWAVVGFVAEIRGDDWPQWMGPKRDNEWRETGLLESIPKDGLKVVWRSKVAGGYAGPAVAKGKVYVADYVTADNVKVDNFDRKEFTGQERVLCLDEKTGKELWKHEYAVTYGISYPAGPRCTPTVDGDRVYTLGAEGQLICFQAADGKIVWERNLRDEYKTKSALWGYAAHPLIDGDKLITLAGGEGSHVVALDKKTGKEIWRAGTASEQGYVPPSIIEHAGVRQTLVMSPDGLSSLDPESGKKLWSVDYKADNGSVIMTPIKVKDHVYFGGWNNKNLLVKLAGDKPGAETVYRDIQKAGISAVNVQPKLVGDMIVGLDQGGELMAIEPLTGKRLWTTPEPVSKGRPAGSGTAFLVKQGERWWMFAENGDLVLGEIGAKGFKEKGRAKVLEPTNNAFGRPVVWCAPAFANKRMYVRNDAEIVCVDMAK